MSDKTNVLARLTARDAQSLAFQQGESTAEADKVAAVARLISVLTVPMTAAGPLYKKMVRFLQESDLTINFTAYKFFNGGPAGETYDNQFGGTGQHWGSTSYLKKRDAAEEAMFDFAGVKGAASTVPPAVLARMQKYGQFDTNPVDFEPITRPKYAALNFTRNEHGAASQWGKSFFVLKEHVKLNCTFVETDSFAFIASSARAYSHVATYCDFSRLIRYINDNMLKALHDVVRSMSPIGFRYGGTNYIEAHMHGELQFSRDIAKIVISKAEVADSQIKSAAATFPQYLREVTEKKVRKNIQKFAEKHGISVEEVA